MIADLAEAALTRAELKQSTARYRLLFENMLEGCAYCRMIWEDDQPVDFVYLAVNQSFSRLTGLRDVVGRRVSEVVPGIIEADPELLKRYGRVTRSGIPEQFVMHIESLDIWCSISVHRSEPGHFVAVFDNITARRKAEEDASFQNAILSTQQEVSIDGILVVDEHSRIVSYNSRFVELWGVPPSLVAAKEDAPLLKYVTSALADPEAFLDRVQYLYEHRNETSREEIVLADGRIFDRYSAPMWGPDRRYFGRVWNFRDITPQKQLEEQLRQSQKMEAIGLLAGGVAHDFNNLLAVMRGNAELLLMHPDRYDKHTLDCLRHITAASDRAAGLTRQLLAFGRKQVLQPRQLRLNDVIANWSRMLDRIIGENIHVEFRYTDSKACIRADFGMMEQVLLNLVVNARDAMPQGGNLLIATDFVTLETADALMHPERSTGDYVTLTVTDSGTGIPPEIVARIFEPFFTTKAFGKGSGLGLATVHGIVKQHDGWIEVHSVPQVGTTFRVFLPAVRTVDVIGPESDSPSPPPVGSEQILLVEDEPAVRVLIRQVLESGGYKVREVASGREALALRENDEFRIDLLLTDIVMPGGVSGLDLASRLRAKEPTLRVVYMSGYSADVAGKDVSLLPGSGTRFLQKPVSADLLLRTLREVLDESEAAISEIRPVPVGAGAGA